MKCSVLTVFVLSAVALASAHPFGTMIELEQPQQQLQSAQLNDDGGRGWQTWHAFRNWIRPATNYITQSLPDKTPTEFASDVRDAAVDLKDKAKDHPVVQGVSKVVQPVHQWIKEKANGLSTTTFRDIFDSAKTYVQTADERVAQWLNNRRQQQNAYPLSENIVQILH